MYLFQKIEEVMMQYHDARKSIGEFILQERGKICNYSMQEIANYTYTSKATLVRFAKTLGFSGWKEFMKAFTDETIYQESHYSDIDPNFPFDKHDTIKEITNKICNLQVESILDTADLIQEKSMEDAVQKLLQAHTVFVFGMSPNMFIGELFRRKMLTIGKNVEIASMGESGILARTLTEGDCAIIISYSGNNEFREPMSHVKILKENHVPMIAITSDGNNYLREHIDCVLTISSRERLYTKVSNFATEQSILLILNALYACFFAKNYQENFAYKIQVSKELEYRRQASLIDMEEYGENEKNLSS